jgi:hypothetical protein
MTGKKALCLLFPMLLLVGAMSAQVQQMRVRTNDDLQLLERDARLGLTKALMLDDLDSIRYWRDLHVVDERRRTPDTIDLFGASSRAVLSFHAGDAHELLAGIRNGEHYFTPRPWGKLDHVLRYQLVDLWALYTDLVLDRVEAAPLPFPEREMLSLYWMVVLNDLHAYSYGIGYAQEYINEKATGLLSMEMEPMYHAFIRDHVRHEYHASRSMIGGSAAPGMSRFTDPLGRYTGQTLAFLSRGEWFHSRLLINMTFQFQSVAMTGNVQMDTLLLSIGDRLSSTLLGVGAGVVLFDIPGMRSLLSAGAHGTISQHRLTDTTHFSGVNIGPMAELAFDIKIGRNRSTHEGWQGTRREWGQERRSVQGLRLMLGYYHNAAPRKMEHQGGVVSLSLGYMIYSRRTVRRM